MFLCPRCGNPYETSAKYCPCCGNATGDISVTNPEDTTFLYCAPSEGTPQEAPAASPFQAVQDAPAAWPTQAAASPFETPQASQMPVTPQDNTLTSPIWVTRSITQPITGPLDESFLDDPSINPPSGENSYAGRIDQSYISRISSSASADVDVDIFDEVFETTALIYSNIPSKLKKVIIISLITALLSLIPIIYVACSQQKGPGLSKEIQASLTEERATSWNIDYGM